MTPRTAERPGTKTEVPTAAGGEADRRGIARLANSAEAQAFRELQAEAKRAADQLAAAAKVQLAVLSAMELESCRGSTKSKG